MEEYDWSLEFVKMEYENHGYGDYDYNVFMKIDPKVFTEKFYIKDGILGLVNGHKISDDEICFSHVYLLNFDPNLPIHLNNDSSFKNYAPRIKLI